MPVPTHGPFCRTLVYPTDCWYCGSSIHVLQCTCGSAVLLDKMGWPWPKHDCSGASGIGGSGLSGWAAVDVLRANGIPIDASILQKAFPSSARQGSRAPEPATMEAIQPKAGAKASLLAVVRDLHTDTKRTKSLGELGGVGAKFLGLPKGDLWQATLVVNHASPNLTYTCILPAALGLPPDAKNKIAFAQIEGRVGGTHAIWLVTDIRLL